jgi:hypothetical protein
VMGGGGEDGVGREVVSGEMEAGVKKDWGLER